MVIRCLNCGKVSQMDTKHDRTNVEMITLPTSQQTS